MMPRGLASQPLRQLLLVYTLDLLHYVHVGAAGTAGVVLPQAARCYTAAGVMCVSKLQQCSAGLAYF